MKIIFCLRSLSRIRRDPNLPLPELTDARRLALQERTLLVAGFDRDSTTLDMIIPFFENNFEKVRNPFKSKVQLIQSIRAVVAEWLRRWTRNPMGFPRAGSNPAGCGNVFVCSPNSASPHMSLNHDDFAPCSTKQSWPSG